MTIYTSTHMWYYMESDMSLLHLLYSHISMISYGYGDMESTILYGIYYIQYTHVYSYSYGRWYIPHMVCHVYYMEPLWDFLLLYSLIWDMICSLMGIIGHLSRFHDLIWICTTISYRHKPIVYHICSVESTTSTILPHISYDTNL